MFKKTDPKYNYVTLEEFEKMIKYNDDDKRSFIISNNFRHLDNSSFCLSNLSIFDNEDRGTIKKDKEQVNKILEILMDLNYTPEEKKIKLKKINVDEKEKRAIGCILGMAIGDAMGARLEFLPVRYKYKKEDELNNMGKRPGGHFSLFPGQWTDDTSMGLCLADSLLVNDGKLDPYDLMNRFVAWWGGGYDNAFRYNKTPRHSVGLGGNISWAIKSYLINPTDKTDAGDENTSGNGSIMRNAAIPICFYDNYDLARENARNQSLTTHQGIQAKECCNLLTYIIIQIFKGRKLKEDILKNLGQEFNLNDVKTLNSQYESILYLAQSKQEGSDKNKNWDWKIEEYKYSPDREYRHPGYIGSYAMDNMAMSLHIIYHTKNFKEAIIKAVNLRGDSDSVASVVGQIAGAYYPIEEIPSDWIKAIYDWDKGEIALRGYMLSRLRSKKSSYNNKH